MWYLSFPDTLLQFTSQCEMSSILCFLLRKAEEEEAEREEQNRLKKEAQERELARKRKEETRQAASFCFLLYPISIRDDFLRLKM
jgi:hypothetical protein